MDSITDSEGLARAYDDPLGLYFHEPDESLYLAGTKSVEDIARDWVRLPLGRVSTTKRYKDAEYLISQMEQKPKRIIGHSLGASAAQELAERLGVEGRAYGTPAFDLLSELGVHKQEHTVGQKHAGDPVGLLDRSAQQTKGGGGIWPHSYGGYHIRSNETVS